MCGEEAHAVSCEDLFIYDAEADSTEMVTLGRGQGLYPLLCFVLVSRGQGVYRS